MSGYHLCQKIISIVTIVEDLMETFVILHKFLNVISSIDKNREQLIVY